MKGKSYIIDTTGAGDLQLQIDPVEALTVLSWRRSVLATAVVVISRQSVLTCIAKR